MPARHTPRKARGGARPHRFPTTGASGGAEGYRRHCGLCSALRPAAHGRRAKHKRYTESHTALPRRAERSHACTAERGASRRSCRGQSAYADVGDGAVVEPNEANAVADSDDAAVAAGLRTRAKVDGWTTARTASECANVAERSAPSCRPPHRRRTRPRGCRPRWPRRPNPVCARTVAQQWRSPPQEGATLHGEPSRREASGAAHVEEFYIAELDAHIIPRYHQRVRHAEVERRCAGRRLARAAQHKAQPRREGI
jgi:hypothetical protein